MKVFLARLMVVCICIFLAFQLWIFSSLVWWKYQPVERTMFMRIFSWSEPYHIIEHEWRDYPDISKNFKHAVVASEDARFMQHSGFDWKGIESARDRNQRSGKVVAGGSTITQQLAKNLFLFNRRSYIRKGQEAITTWMIERLWDKQRILEVYMNSVELGKGVYGIEAGAQTYYNKSAKSLSRQQAATLASMLNNPKYYQKHMSDSKLRAKRNVVMRRMNKSRIP